MWLATTFISALIFTSLALLFKNRFKLGFISLMLWGAAIMILVDHLLGYKGGVFLETETNGMIKNSTLLGIIMLVPVILIWLIAIFASRIKKFLHFLQ